MKDDELIGLARDAGASRYTSRHYPDRTTHTFTLNQLHQFVRLVQAAGGDQQAAPQPAVVPVITFFHIHALERAINDLRARGHSLETPDDRWAGLMLHEDAGQLESLLAILKPNAAQLPRAGASNPMWLRTPSDDTEGGAA